MHERVKLVKGKFMLLDSGDRELDLNMLRFPVRLTSVKSTKNSQRGKAILVVRTAEEFIQDFIRVSSGSSEYSVLVQDDIMEPV